MTDSDGGHPPTSGRENRLHISPRHRAMLEALIRERLPGIEVWAYGSRVNGLAHDGSDLDLALRGPGLKKIPAESLANFTEAVHDSTIPFLVEARDWARLPERFHQEIEKEYVVLVETETQSAGSRWRNMPFSEAVQINPRVHLERGKTYPYVDMASVNANYRSVSTSRQRKYSGGGSRFQYGDTLMARITPCLENGKITRFLPNNLDSNTQAHGSTEFIVIRGRPGFTFTDFAYYLTRWEGVCNYAIDQMTGTSGRQRVPTNCLDHLLVPVPPLPEQRAIAHILGTFDDKIELNRRMNETLEEMARALFKYWFVDFGPVRAKMEGRWRRGESLPGLPAELYDLFPDRLVESELGEVPEGWEVKALGTCFKLTMGQSPPGSTYNDRGEGIPFFQGRTDFGFRYPNNRKYCTAPTRLAEADDTLVSVRAPVGDINMAWEQCCVGRGVAALRHKSGTRSFTYYSVLQMQEELKQYEHTGTVFGAVNKKQFKALKFLEATPTCIALFENTIESSDDRIMKNIINIRKCIQARDTLLSKLISGKIRIREAEKMMTTIA